MTVLKRINLAGILLLCLYGAAAQAASETAPAAAASLRARYAELAPRLASNQFKRPLVLESSETPDTLKGDIYALVEHPFAEVSTALNGPSRWCDVLILHLNTKYCRAATGDAGTTLNVSVGKKFDQPLDAAYRVNFAYRQGASTPTYFDTRLDAKKGPLGTSDYRIVLEAVEVAGNKTFLHLTYSYTFGFTSKVAMRAYLSTVGSDKVGFTSAGKQADGPPEYIGGMRGVVERNTMRYYLAIDAYLDAPAATQLDTRLQGWFAATEEYPLQLHEIDRSDYLAMKRREIERQKTAQ